MLSSAAWKPCLLKLAWGEGGASKGKSVLGWNVLSLWPGVPRRPAEIIIDSDFVFLGDKVQSLAAASMAGVGIRELSTHFADARYVKKVWSFCWILAEFGQLPASQGLCLLG